MAKYYGAIGYSTGLQKESEPGSGVWIEEIVERNYYGDVTYNQRRWDNGEHLNDDLNVSNTISVVADAYAYDHFFAIRYITWMGIKWKVHNISVERPRLVMTVGGVYNEAET